ncbi:MAG: 16S rRNA processing protein RimM [Actinobacteria bacterium]|nr:16S rRNA processing protein RimM [Actinomycetota bacterium]
MLLAGAIGKPHGLGGEVYLMKLSDDPHRFDPGSVLMHEDGRELVIEESRVHGADRFLVRFEGVGTREGAVGLRGSVYVTEESRRELEDGEYWVEDLKDLEVVLASGESVGTVSDVISGSAQDLLEIETPGGTKLVPVVPEIVTQVDTDARRVVIDPPAGLLD